jgi:hypothetical protein
MELRLTYVCSFLIILFTKIINFKNNFGLCMEKKHGIEEH